MADSPFTRLAAINVNERIEKKNGLSYLSWAWAVDQLLREDPQATWAYGTPTAFGDTLMVHCTVAAFGKSMTAHLPVMDHRNKAISNPDAFQVNTAMQRCLVKAIALHGLGLYIYAGEDLPEGADEPPKKPHAATRPEDAEDVRSSPAMLSWRQLSPEQQDKTKALATQLTNLVASGAAHEAFAVLDRMVWEDENEYGGLKYCLDSKIRTAIKRAGEERKAA